METNEIRATVFVEGDPNKDFVEMTLSNRPLVVNSDNFDCPICYTDTEPGDGVVLRSCLHSFCRDCITKTIQFSEDVAVKCPFINDEYKCEGFLEEREIKSLLSTDLWEKHLEKSIKLAQGNIENVFYCRTPNCKGWCVFEDDVNEFECPICKAK
uniref:RING-type domain-containing protein n=1 Tax=Megaselia scalaris TaxID=36166 RepID=T1GWB5_MEGSC